MAVGSTKCSRPATIFLSCRIASRISAVGQVGDRRQRAEAGDEIGERLAIPLGERAARHGELGGDEHAVGDRFAVTEPPVLGHRLEGVAGGVAEVQDAAQARFLLVGRRRRPP